MAEKFPFLQPYAKKLESVLDGVRELSVEQLERLRHEIGAVSVSNCGWSTYQVAELLRSEVEWSLRHSMNEAEAKRQATK